MVPRRIGEIPVNQFIECQVQKYIFFHWAMMILLKKKSSCMSLDMRWDILDILR